MYGDWQRMRVQACQYKPGYGKDEPHLDPTEHCRPWPWHEHHGASQRKANRGTYMGSS